MTHINHKIGYKDIKRWYLEMVSPPNDNQMPLPENAEIKRFLGDSHSYRLLNKLIGEDLGWVDRQIMSDEELESIIENPDVKIHVLYYNQEPAGYIELDYRNKEEVILEYFGLGQAYRGKGLGKFLLNWTISEVWKSNPKRFWLHTSDQDHPNALRNYLKAGFKITEERIEQQAIVL